MKKYAVHVRVFHDCFEVIEAENELHVQHLVTQRHPSRWEKAHKHPESAQLVTVTEVAPRVYPSDSTDIKPMVWPEV